ncbi:MAG TPA: PadR family transcriptional regulator [Longimicrobiales bacterium]|nr:PadR family transcriptional regulator [Longimicrobiales bacterium]
MATAPERDPGRHIPMHPLEFQVLLILMDAELHGYGIAKEIERRDVRAGRVLPTNLYRRLRDMGEKGMIAEAPGPGDGQRRVFRITPFGKRVARAEAERMEAMVRSARRHRLLASGAEEG